MKLFKKSVDYWLQQQIFNYQQQLYKSVAKSTKVPSLSVSVTF